VTSDGTLIIGPSTVADLWQNTGPGTPGRTMAAGSGRVLADMISGCATDSDTAGPACARYRRSATKTPLRPLTKPAV